MLSFIIRRIGQSAIVLLIVGLVAFSMFNFVGDPIDNMLGQERTQEDIDRLRAQLGLDQPFPVQYFRFLQEAVQGNFGVSYRQGREVSEILMERAPATLELAAVSAVLAILLGIAFGVYTAIRRGGFVANFIMSTSLIGVSLPTFLIGILLIYLFSVELNWLPSFGRGEVVQLGWWSTGLLTESGLKSLILPSITLGLYQSNTSVILMNFTLQFIAPEHRQAMLQSLYNALLPGGILILSEKITHDSALGDELLINLHHQFKSDNGYSDLEISQKRTALEKVMLTDTYATHEYRLREIGFTDIIKWFSCFNFMSLVAIK